MSSVNRSPKQIIDDFARLFVDANSWANITWLGVPVLKNPFDLWIYQEIICEIRPDLIIETGTYKGGSAYYFARLFDLINHGKIITVDPYVHSARPEHPRIEYVTGSSIEQKVIYHVYQAAVNAQKVMVILDSDHRMEHVLQELRLYSPLVTVGSYLVVEDTQLNGNPVWPHTGPGPNEALLQFKRENDNFISDRTREKLLHTFYPGGYLKRVK